MSGKSVLRVALVVAAIGCGIFGAASPGPDALDAGEKKGEKKGKLEHDATIVTVDTKTREIVVEIDVGKGGKGKAKGKPKSKKYHLAESVKLFDGKGKVATIDIFKKGDHVKIVEQEGMIHEMHQKQSGDSKDGKHKAK